MSRLLLTVMTIPWVYDIQGGKLVSRERIAELREENSLVDLETALFVARVGVNRVVEILEAQPKRVLDGCGRERGELDGKCEG